ncbi:hypothetical protein SCHPADRAFT_692561 [Schizopora paradoxa]|uniref:F-box domain-containing protein n=1 Tax=Schizopora paradoxa TaxID=27342 RepID=A0A0H2RA42_9AGAM|nr:hypothetical protein SCHPADRAFT_692561 [Schizopora paradoxa]
MAVNLERRRDVGGRIDKSCLKILVKEFGFLDGSPNYGTLYDDLRNAHGLSNAQFAQFDAGSRNPATIALQMHGVYKLSRIIELLDIFTKEATKLHDEAMARVGPIGNSVGNILNRMPDELLSLTMEHACSGLQDLVMLSHVNRRFRGVAEGLSHMCTDITPSLTPAELEASLVWSRNAGLHVKLSQYQCVPFTKYDIPIEPYLDKIVPASHRWKSLEILCASKEFMKSTTGYTQIQTRLTGLDLSRLQSLKYTYMGDFKPGSSTLTVVDSPGHIYNTWKAPNLRDVTFNKIIPYPYPHSITTLTLELQERGPHDLAFSNDLLAVNIFLKESPSVEVLRIFTTSRSRGATAINYPKLKMPNVREVSLRCSFDGLEVSEAHPLSCFMRSLDVQNLSTLVIRFELFNQVNHYDANNPANIDVDITDMIMGLVPMSRSRIETLGISITSIEHNNLRPSFNLPFQNFWSLRDLTLEFWGYSNNIILASDSPVRPYDFPPINHISLFGCHEGGTAFLEEVYKLLAKTHGAESKPRVDVRFCSSIEKARALEIVGDDYLKYNPER